MKKLHLRKKPCYLLGDYNVNLLNYETHVQCNDILNALYGYSFRPLIDKPTRITSNTVSLIDNVFTNSVETHQSGLILADLSDHLPIFILGPNLRQNKEKQVYSWKRDICSHNMTRLQNELANIDWNSVLLSGSVEKCYKSFVKELNDLFDKCIPY